MRTIIKQPAASNFNLENVQKNRGIPTTSAEATKAWSGFKDVEHRLFYQLLIEQYGLCCYTELNLADLKDTHKIGSHFEHEQPKSLYPHKTFDQSNLLRCALDSADLHTYNGNNRFGGHYKDNNNKHNYDDARFISPQSAGCRFYFSYLSYDGSIVPKHGLSAVDKDKAQYTINLLNLNAPFLKAQRERYLVEIIAEIDKLVKDNALSGLEHLAQCELTLTERQCPHITNDLTDRASINKAPFLQLRAFHSAVRAEFGRLGERVIKQHCEQIG